MNITARELAAFLMGGIATFVLMTIVGLFL